MILGITGGLGCGKTTAARLFEKRGFRHLDSDALVREKVLTAARGDGGACGRVTARRFSGPTGAVDRAALAERVFADEAELRWLEGLTHPLVFELWREALGSDPTADWAVEAPLLFEQSLENWFDFTVCVASTLDQQLLRLERRGLNRALAGQRISKQLPLARKIELADFVLWNEGSAEFLQAQVDRLSLPRSTGRSPPLNPALILQTPT